MSNEKCSAYFHNMYMKIQPIRFCNFKTQNIKTQIKDALSVYKYLGLPVVGFIGIDFLKEKIKKNFDFYDKMGL